MLPVKIQKDDNSPLRILCLGAHCDDIEIGCGGTILEMLQEYRDASVFWQVFASNPQRKAEAQACANRILKNAGTSEVRILDFRDGFLPDHWREVKEAFEVIKSEINPDIIFTHYRNDLHQDHRVVSELTWNTFRDNLILEYEILKFDGDIGNPNIYVPVSPEHTEEKIDAILQSFDSQKNKHWFTGETFKSLMRVRAVETSGNAQYAEAFYGRKIPLEFRGS